jgi:hypothetical protein
VLKTILLKIASRDKKKITNKKRRKKQQIEKKKKNEKKQEPYNIFRNIVEYMKF